MDGFSEKSKEVERRPCVCIAEIRARRDRVELRTEKDCWIVHIVSIHGYKTVS
jgi:hypothetical protein